MNETESGNTGSSEPTNPPSALQSSTPSHGEEIRTTSITGGMKGVKEERYDLIPVDSLRWLAILYGRGAVKYDAHNYRKGYEWSKSYAALQRHLNKFWAGEDYDEETGVPHVICAAWHCFALSEFMEDRTLPPEYDDRFRGF